MSVKTAGTGHFLTPTAPAAGTAVAQSASANTYGTKTNIGGTALGALYITGVYIEVIAGTNLPTYVGVQLYVTASTVIDTMNVPLGPTSGVASTQWAVYKPIFPPVPVAASTQILAATASSVASAISYLVTLECLLATNYVDDGVAVGTVTTVTNQLTAAQVATGVWQDTTSGDFTTALSVGKSVMNGVALGTGLTVNDLTTKTGFSLSAAGIQAIWDALTSALTTVGSIGKLIVTNLDALISSRMATYTQPSGFLAATFPAGTVANTTNITAGTVTTATNLTNAPTAGDFTAAMKTSLNAATPASVVGAVGSVTGNVGGNVTGSVGSVVGAVGSVTGLTASNLDTTVSSRLASASYTAPDNADVLLIKAKTDNLPASPAATSDIPSAATNASAVLSAAALAPIASELKKINGVTVNGDGAGTPWGP